MSKGICPVCRGKGYSWEEVFSFFGFITSSRQTKCRPCNGTGTVWL